MAHDDIEDGRNIRTAQDEWNNGGIAVHRKSNVHSLLTALLSEADRIDDDLQDIYDAQHINQATGEDLDKFGSLIGLSRVTGESDDRYRARIKARITIAKLGTTFDQYVEFVATFLNTDTGNIEITESWPQGHPAEIEIRVDRSIWSSLNFTNTETKDILDDGVPAGHEIRLLESGTFEVKKDGAADDADKGLTGDNISTGGTLAADLI